MASNENYHHTSPIFPMTQNHHHQSASGGFIPAINPSPSSRPFAADYYLPSPETYFPIEYEFDRLCSLSDAPPTFQAAPYGGGIPIVRNNPCCFPNNNSQYSQKLSYDQEDIMLHRLRLQESAARVQNNYHGFPAGNYYENNLDRLINNGDFDYRRSSNRSYSMGYGNQLMISSNRNNNNFINAANCRPRRNGVESINWDNVPFGRSVSRPASSFSSLSDLRGRIFLAAKDQHGCRFLQEKFEEGNPEDIQMIFSELKDHICELIVDQFGNYMVQKLFEVCNVDQMTQLLCLLINDDHRFKNICTDIHGTRAVQKLLEHLTTGKQISLAISVLRRITVYLTKNMNGHHVIQHCLKFFSPEDSQHILNVVADNCLDIATDKCGCCVLQQCVAHAQGEARQRLIAEITSNALILSEHPYGNYVVQYILGLRQMHVTADITAQLSGSYVSLSMNKYGSNVVEKCLKESEGSDQVRHILEEIIRSPNFLRVLQDPYGNYVAQCALNISKGAIHNAITEFICGNYAFLHSHPHGKRVLQKIKGSKLRA